MVPDAVRDQPGDWYVTANMPAGNTAVVSFPNVGESYNSNLLTSFSSIYSSFSEDMNPTAGTSAEAAYDIWLNNWNNEVMIQHDMVNRGGPCGPVLATASFGGHGGVPVQSWNLCQYGSELIWQVPASGSQYGEQSGSVDILAMLELAGEQRRIPAAGFQPDRDRLRLRDLQHGRGGREVPGQRLLDHQQSLIPSPPSSPPCDLSPALDRQSRSVI